MLSVYNYLAHDLVSRTPACSAHKRRELRNIYRSIVTMSASEPLYKIDLSEQKQANAVSIKENAIKLKELITSFQKHTKERPGLFLSDNSDAVSAYLTNSGYRNDSLPATLSVTVSELAGGQQNTGTILSSEACSLKEGTYGFNVDFGEESYAFSFRVTKDAPNFELQSKLSDFINKTGISLHSQVLYHKEKGLCRLSLSSEVTGRRNRSSFRLTDTEKPAGAASGLIEAFGLDNISVEARDASFTVNGEAFTSKENVTVYQDAVCLSLKQLSMQPVKLTGTSSLSSFEERKLFVDSFNELVRSGRKAMEGNKSSAFLLCGLSHAISEEYSALFSEGITEREDGTLVLSDQKSEEQTEWPTGFFEESSAFPSRLIKRLDSIILNPMRFVDKKLVTYPNPEAAGKKGASTYVTSVYSGMLFNNYC